MFFTLQRRWAAVFAAGLGTMVSAGVAVSPAYAFETPATATYALDHGVIFTGQTVSLLRQSVTGNDDDGMLFSTIDWGDGSASSLYGADSVASHTYDTPGSFRVAVTVADLDGPGLGVVAGTDTVRVDRVAGTYRLDKPSVWRGWQGTQPVSLSLAGVPANVTGVKVAWGDGNQSVVARDARPVVHEFAYAGDHTVTVRLVTSLGESSPLAVGGVRVSSDYAPPSVRLTVPAKANRAASWATVRGVITDGGAGASTVTVVVVQQRGKKTYYYNGKKWIKAPYARAKPILLTPKNGAWSLPVKGLTKGTLVVTYTATDRVGNATDHKTKVATLTR